MSGAGPGPGAGPGYGPGRVVAVTGGVAGVTATYAHLRVLAAAYDDTAGRLRGWSADVGSALLDEALLRSAPLSPWTFGEVEWRLGVLATDVLLASPGWELDAVAVRGAVAALEECDALVADGLAGLQHDAGVLAGRALVVAAPGWVPVALVGTGVAALVWPRLPDDDRTRVLEGLERGLVRHPAVAEGLAGAGGGLLEGALGVPLDGPDDAAGLLAQAYDDGPVAVREVPAAVPAGADAPDDVGDLVEHLRQLSELSGPASPEHDGTFEVQTLAAPDGSRRHVVYLPGTDDMTTLPWTQDGTARDMAGNLQLLAGQDTGYTRGVLDALGQAGVRPGEPVLLAGHSQGGMAAAHLLAHGGDAPYELGHAVTVGAPTSQVAAFPEGSRVLSLENHGDLVPLADGAPGRDSLEQVTVVVDGGGRGVAGHHSFGPYAAAAAAVDASAHPSVVAHVGELRAAGFLGGTLVASRVFQVVRE